MKLTFAFVALALGATSQAATVSLTSSNDTYLRSGFSYTANGATDNLDFRFDFTSYFQFDMSALGGTVNITSATLTLHKIGNARNDTMVTGRAATYALNDAVGNTEQDWDEASGGWSGVSGEDHGLDYRNVGADWLSGTGAVASNLTSLDQDLGANVVETANNTTGVYTISGTDLVAFLNGRVGDDGLVTFVVEATDTGGRGWGWATKEHADSALHPTLDIIYSTVPEPSATLLGGLGLIGLLRRRRG